MIILYRIYYNTLYGEKYYIYIKFLAKLKVKLPLGSDILNKKAAAAVFLILYSFVLVFSSFIVGRATYDADTKEAITVTEKEEPEEETYTAKESKGKLSVYKGDKLLMSLDTNVEMLPSVVRSQLKEGIDFKASELPGLLEAFAE